MRTWKPHHIEQCAIVGSTVYKLVVTRTLQGAPGIATRNKKLVGATLVVQTPQSHIIKVLCEMSTSGANLESRFCP